MGDFEIDTIIGTGNSGAFLTIDEISDFEIKIVEDLLNNRPRKVLNCETLLEVFNRLSKQTPVVALHT